jgi:ADP-heptose:LPS heptosyltransferase
MNPEGREAPFWLGEDLKGKTIVLHGEQGIGDELLFLQFVPEFQKAHPDTRIVLDVHPRLCTAIQRSFPDIQDIFPTRKTTPEWNTVLRVDYKDGIGSLPKWYYASRRKNAGWLKNDAVLAEKYRLWVNGIQEKFNQKDKPVIGIAWTGGRKKTRTDLRSIPLDQWLPVLKQDATFVSLDYNPGAEMQAGEFYKKHGIPVHHWPDVTENTDYEHSLALAGVCDLVICVNTSIVHARGSMDLPCWTLTPHGHAWRYGKKDTINPFYNSVKQYHQEDGQDWDVALNKVAKDLRRYIKFVKGSDNAAA